MVGNVDIMPSVLELAGVQIPENVDGKSWASSVVNGSEAVHAAASEWRQVFLSEYMAHANQYFKYVAWRLSESESVSVCIGSICGTWFGETDDFHGEVERPEAVDEATGHYIWVDYGDNEDAMGSNTWREIRIINATHNWSYAEYVNSSFSEQAKESPYLRILFDVNEDPFQVDNVYHSVDESVQQELHDMLMEYGSCSAATCP